MHIVCTRVTNFYGVRVNTSVIRPREENRRGQYIKLKAPVRCCFFFCFFFSRMRMIAQLTEEFDSCKRSKKKNLKR